MDGLHDLGGKQGFSRVKYPSAPHNENWRPLVRALHAFAIESHIAYREGNRNTGGTRVAGRWTVPIVVSVGTRPTSFCSTILCNRRDSARQERAPAARTPRQAFTGKRDEVLARAALALKPGHARL